MKVPDCEIEACAPFIDEVRHKVPLLEEAMARGKKCGGDAEASDARVGGGGSEWKCECEKSFLNGSQERLRGGETRGKARGEGDVVRCIGSAKDNRVCLMSCPELREHFLNHQKQSRSKSYECQSACTLLVICKTFFAC